MRRSHAHRRARGRADVFACRRFWLIACRFFGLIACQLFWLSIGCSTHPQPVPVAVHFLGHMKLYRVSSQVLPRYEPGDELQLLLEPEHPTEAQCDPFAGGRLGIRVLDGDGKKALELELPLEPPYVVPVDGAWLMRPVPAALAAAGTAVDPFKLAGREGRWRLELTWQCAAGAGRPRSSSYPFLNQTGPGSSGLWRERLAGIDALPAAQRAERLEAALEAALDPATRMWVLGELFQAVKEGGDYLRAERIALDWAASTGPAGFPSEEIRAWMGAFEAARDLSQLYRADTYLKRALELGRSLDYRLREATASYSRCTLLERLGEPLEALEACGDAQAAAIRTGRSDIRAYAELWELALLQRLGHHALVNRRLQEEWLSRDEHDPVVLNNLGTLVLGGLEAGLPVEEDTRLALDRAASIFAKSLSEFEARGNTPEVANQLACLAGVALLRGDAARARALLEQASALAGQTQEELQLSLSRLRAELILDEGRYDAAREQFEALERRAGAGGWQAYAGEAAFGQGEALRRQGDLAAASGAYARALEWLEHSAGARSPLHRGAVLGSRARWEARAIQVLLDQGHALRALQLAEQRSWLRRQTLARRSDGRPVPSELQSRVTALRAEIDGLDRELFSLAGSRSSPDALAHRRLTEQLRLARWGELETLLAADERPMPPAPPLEELQRRLAAGTAVLRFAQLPDELVVWELTPERISVRRVPVSRFSLEDLIEQFTTSCRAGAPDREIGERLSGMLLGHWRTQPPARLSVVSDGSLRDLPWPALPVAGGRLVQRSELQLLQHLVIEPRLTAGQEQVPVIVADPGRDLPAAAAEGRRLADSLPGRTLLWREAATRAAVLEWLPKSRLFHFAGHGAADAQNPYRSHLKLAGREQLSLMDIDELQLQGPVVFLSACEAGKVVGEGGETLGIADGFIHAGASAVVASLWDVPDAAASRLSQAFYARFGPGRAATPAAALHEAVRAVSSDSSSPAADPSVWSSFFVLTVP